MVDTYLAPSSKEDAFSTGFAHKSQLLDFSSARRTGSLGFSEMVYRDEQVLVTAARQSQAVLKCVAWKGISHINE
jgi:hypothetical protein